MNGAYVIMVCEREDCTANIENRCEFNRDPITCNYRQMLKQIDEQKTKGEV